MLSAGMLTEADLVSADQVQFKPAGSIPDLLPSRGIRELHDPDTRVDGDEQRPGETDADREDLAPLPTAIIDDPAPLPQASPPSRRTAAATSSGPQHQPAPSVGDSGNRWPLSLRLLVWLGTGVGGLAVAAFLVCTYDMKIRAALTWTLLPCFFFLLIWGKTRIHKA